MKWFILILLTSPSIFSYFSYGQENKILFDSIKKDPANSLIVEHKPSQNVDSIIMFKSGKITTTDSPVFTITTTAEKRSADSILKADRKQLYPNPFAPVTTSSYYNLKEKTIFTITVFDTLYNEIIQLINKELTMGEYNVNFSIFSTLKPEIYFLETKYLTYSQLRRLIVRE